MSFFEQIFLITGVTVSIAVYLVYKLVQRRRRAVSKGRPDSGKRPESTGQEPPKGPADSVAANVSGPSSGQASESETASSPRRSALLNVFWPREPAESEKSDSFDEIAEEFPYAGTDTTPSAA